MSFVKLLKIIIQMTFTTLAVMGVVIFLVGLLPDYSSFELEQNSVLAQAFKTTDQSFLHRNWNFWQDCLFKNMGLSRVHKDRSVGEILRRDGSITLGLLFFSIMVSAIFGTIIGLVAGIKKDSIISKLIDVIGLFVTSLPSFLLVPILIYFFALKWSVFPVGLWVGPQSFVLPVVALSARPIFFLARIFAEELNEASKELYIITAKAKGLKYWSIWFYHVIPNSITSLIIGIGNLFGQLITGTFLVETLFALPGLGFLFVKSLSERDYPVFLGLVLIFTIALQLGHRLSDIILQKFGEVKLSEQELAG